MTTIFKYRSSRLRGQILGWGISLALLGVLLVQFYGTVVEQQDQLNQLLDVYPKEMMAFFGDFDDFASPSGYLSIEFFSYLPLILGVYVVLIGSGLLVSDEESGRLDLIMAHPISRSAFYWGRLLAFVAASLAIVVIIFLGLVIPAQWTPLSEVGIVEMAQPFVSLLAVLLFFATLALVLSMLLPSRRTAAMVTGLGLVASFFIPGLARLDADLEPVATLSPLHYYQGGAAIDGLNVTWVAGLVAASAFFSLLAWWRFERRDIRVGGEGGWQRPALASLSRHLPGRRTEPQTTSAPETAAAQR